MAKKQTLAGRKKKTRDAAKKTVTKNAEIARKILSDPGYPIFKEQLQKAAKVVAKSKSTLLRQKGGDVQEQMIELRILQFKEDFFRNFADTPQDWLATERSMKAEEKIEKRYEREST